MKPLVLAKPRAVFLAGCVIAIVSCASDDETATASPDMIADTTSDGVGPAPDSGAGEDTQDAGDTANESTLIDYGPQPTTTTEWAWSTTADDGEAGSHQYSQPVEKFYEYRRFEVFESFRLRAVRVKADVLEPGNFTVMIWDDFGGDRLALDHASPMRTLSVPVTVEHSGTWLEIAVDPPLEVAPGRIFFIGTIVDGDGPRIRVDEGQTMVDGTPPESLIWFSQQVAEDTGVPTVYSAAAGDFMVEAEIQRFDVVAPEDALFESAEEFPSLSRGAFEDIDGDGDDDLMLSGGVLMLNEGGTMVDASDRLPEGIAFNGGTFGDYDNDGDPDWFGTGNIDVLLRNDSGQFVDVTADSGIDDTQSHLCDGVKDEHNVPTEAAAFLDYDGDGYLDLYQGNFICWSDGVPSVDRLWRNQGDGTFLDVTVSAGLTSGPGPQASRGLAPADYDNDGDMDLLVTNYRLNRNFHWRNNGDGTFTDVGEQTRLAGERTSTANGWTYGHSIGAVWGDFDLNGRLDVFVANLAHPRFFHFSDKQRLYLNVKEAEYFLDVTADAAIRYQETPSNPTAWDFDNDGDLDLIWTCVYEGRPTQFYRNDYPFGTWTEVTHPSGLNVQNGWGSAVADIDLDGDLDYLSRSGFRNRNRAGNHAIQIRPMGSGAGATNRSGYGARVTVTTGNRSRMHELTGAHGTGVSDSPWLHFGLSKATAADVVVEFPVSGTVLELPSLAAGRYTVHEDGTLETLRVGP
ncbi:MAG: hypothetical protein ACI9OJ_002237 [Myxococcota bacterium]|jgi:hypothetical protein